MKRSLQTVENDSTEAVIISPPQKKKKKTIIISHEPHSPKNGPTNDNIITTQTEPNLSPEERAEEERLRKGGDYLTIEQIFTLWKLIPVMNGRGKNKKVVIGILDSGIDVKIEDKYQKIHWEFYPSDKSGINDDHENGHGTVIASIFAELLYPFIENGGDVTICVYKVSHIDKISKQNGIYAGDAIEVLKKATLRGCDIVNISWTFDEMSEDMKSKLQQELEICERKAKIFMSSGHQSKPGIPAVWANDILKNSFCVSTLDNTSPAVGANIKAPGFILINDKKYKGTSFSTPIAAAVYIMTGKTINQLVDEKLQELAVV